jgi:hypothetical protein
MIANPTKVSNSYPSPRPIWRARARRLLRKIDIHRNICSRRWIEYGPPFRIAVRPGWENAQLVQPSPVS